MYMSFHTALSKIEDKINVNIEKQGTLVAPKV